MNEVTQTNIAELVRDKVRATILESIPQEQIDKLILSEYSKFFVRPAQERWSDKASTSPFETLVAGYIQSEIADRIKAAAAAELAKFSLDWSNEGTKVVAEAVKALAPGMIQRAGEMMVQNVINNMKNQGMFR